MRDKLRDPARQLVALISLIVVLLGVAVGVSVWRFGIAIESDHLALEESQIQARRSRGEPRSRGRPGSWTPTVGQGPRRPARPPRSEKDLERSLAALRPHVASDKAEADELDEIVAGDRKLDPSSKTASSRWRAPRTSTRREAVRRQLNKVRLSWTSSPPTAATRRAEAAAADADERNARLVAILAGLLALAVAIFTASTAAGSWAACSGGSTANSARSSGRWAISSRSG